MWKKFYENITKGYRDINIQPPATSKDVAFVEEALGVSLPQELVSLLLEMNGDNDFLMSTEKIVARNRDVRESYDYLMPLDCLLFFAHNGCGDFYGYSIQSNGEITSKDIFMWRHETDDRINCASSLKELIERYYADEI